MDQRQYLLVINHIVSSVFNSVEELRGNPEFSNLEVLLITNQPNLAKRYSEYLRPEQVINCDFTDDKSLGITLQPYSSNIVGVICRGDKHIQYLRKVLDFLPPKVLVSSGASLEAATNKRLMRKKFLEHYPEITPKFQQVFDSSESSINDVESNVGYPVIVKPSNLFSSLLIQACSNRSELENALQNLFSYIKETYHKEGIGEQPEAIVEEYLEGDFYSIDAFALGSGDVYCCPPVGYIPAKKLGIDDFFLYRRFIPTDLDKSKIISAMGVTKKAILALGLTYSSSHVELILTANGWKVIEIGPRLGRFRNSMYGLSYGINLSLNDAKIHLGIKPEIPDKLLQNCSAYSIYPKTEGRLVSINGLEDLKKSSLLKNFRLLADPGDQCHFAKNGGHALAEFVIASSDLSEFQQLAKYIDNDVYAVID